MSGYFAITSTMQGDTPVSLPACCKDCDRLQSKTAADGVSLIYRCGVGLSFPTKKRTCARKTMKGKLVNVQPTTQADTQPTTQPAPVTLSPPQPLRKKIDRTVVDSRASAAIQAKIDAGESFTAYDITQVLRADHPDENIPHRWVNSYVRSNWYTLPLGREIDTTLPGNPWRYTTNLTTSGPVDTDSDSQGGYNVQWG